MSHTAIKYKSVIENKSFHSSEKLNYHMSYCAAMPQCVSLCVSLFFNKFTTIETVFSLLAAILKQGNITREAVSICLK